MLDTTELEKLIVTSSVCMMNSPGLPHNEQPVNACTVVLIAGTILTADCEVP